MPLLRDQRNKRKFRQERRQADQAGGQVCGTYLPSGEPVYFTVPAGASNESIYRRAFEIRHGRPMNEREELMAGMNPRGWVQGD